MVPVDLLNKTNWMYALNTPIWGYGIAPSTSRRIFFFKQKTAYEIASCLVGSEMCIRDRAMFTAYVAVDDYNEIA